ncbi:MAG: hypothetical protein JRG83_22760 [Deltaproteobacteria bacterium]|nr:hypothetical protein [Deltaproteobacteria bacterium]
MSPTDRAIRIACQGVVILWIATFLGWRDLTPREVRVAVKATAIETRELPPPPEERAPEPEEIAVAEPEPEPEEKLEPEPEPEQAAEVEAPEPPAEEIAEIDPPAPAPEPEPEELAVVDPPSPAPQPLDRTAVEPELEPAPAAPTPLPVAAAAAPEPAPLEAAPVPLQAVDEADVARGGSLLTGEAGFPMLESRYEGYGSFRQYARAMQKLGAQFVIVNRREIVSTIDPWTLERGTLTNAAGLSPRARDFAGEPELVLANRTARREHGLRAEVMMLVPRRLDAGLFGGIARALEAKGHEPGSYRQIRARYERGPAGELHLRVEAAVRRDGGEDPLPLLFDIDELAGGARA